MTSYGRYMPYCGLYVISYGRYMAYYQSCTHPCVVLWPRRDVIHGLLRPLFVPLRQMQVMLLPFSDLLTVVTCPVTAILWFSVVTCPVTAVLWSLAAVAFSAKELIWSLTVVCMSCYSCCVVSYDPLNKCMSLHTYLRRFRGLLGTLRGLLRSLYVSCSRYMHCYDRYVAFYRCERTCYGRYVESYGHNMSC